jgi:serine protease
MHKLSKKSLCSLFLAGSIFLNLQLVRAEVDLSSSIKSIEDETVDGIIVKYKSTQTSSALSSRSSSIQDMASRKGISIKYQREGALKTHVYKLQSQMSIVEAIKLAKEIKLGDINVEYAEPNRILRPDFVPNDTRYNEQWHLFETTGGIRAPTAWDLSTGSGVKVAVLDTGYLSHGDLSANILAGYDFISSLTRANDGNGRDSNALDPGDGCGSKASTWHGTHVAGTIAARTNNSSGVAGVAYNSKIVPVRVLGCGGGDYADIADGIVWAAGGSVPGVPTNKNPARVLNLSLGGQSATCSTTLQNAIDSALARKAVIVVSAGNNNGLASNSQPANCVGVITVAASNRTGGKASYSNYGSAVEVSAPGGENSSVGGGVLSTYNTGYSSPGTDTYDFRAGTSMAAPHVSGVAALLLARNITLTPSQILSKLQETARAFPVSCSGCGSGIVDARAALLATPLVTVPITVPSTPTSLRSNPSGSIIRTNYSILWNASTSGTVSFYELQRDTDNSFSAPNLGTSRVNPPSTSQSFTVGNTERTFYFRVRACAGEGACSGWSSTISRLVMPSGGGGGPIP